MKRIILLLSLSFLTLSSLSAQSPNPADSLRALLNAHPQQDTVRLDLMHKLAAALMFSDPGGECLELGKGAIRLADSLGDTRRLARAHNLTATCYKNAGLWDKSLNQYLSSLRLYEKLNNTMWMANLHSNIAIIYLNKGDLEQCKKEQETSLDIRNRTGYREGISGLFNGMGNYYDQMGNSKEALRYYQMALDSIDAKSTPYDKGIYLSNIGASWGSLGKYDLCRKYNAEALSIYKQIGMEKSNSLAMHNIGEAWYREGRYDSAEKWVLAAYELADSLNNHLVMKTSSEVLMHISKKRSQFEEALRWAERFHAAADSQHKYQLQSEDKARELAYRIEQKEREDQFNAETITLQKDEALKRQRILLWSLGAGLLLLAAFAFVVTRRYMEKKQLNQLLEDKVAHRTQQLQASNLRLRDEMAQKEHAGKTLTTFIYRSSHDLKGPLTSLKGLVEVARAEKTAFPYIEHIGAKVRQMDGVLQQLIDKVEMEERMPVKQEVNWQKVWEETATELGQRPGMEETEFEVTLPQQGRGPLTDPVLIKIAMRQLVQNAIDFRTRGRQNRVSVALAPDAQGRWALTVKDEGTGMEAALQSQVGNPFFRGSLASTGAGLGLHITMQIAVRLGLQFHLESSPGSGTRVSLTFP